MSAVVKAKRMQSTKVPPKCIVKTSDLYQILNENRNQMSLCRNLSGNKDVFFNNFQFFLPILNMINELFISVWLLYRRNCLINCLKLKSVEIQHLNLTKEKKFPSFLKYKRFWNKIQCKSIKLLKIFLIKFLFLIPMPTPKSKLNPTNRKKLFDKIEFNTKKIVFR